MILHEVYCVRHLYKCAKCEKPVEKSAREAHDQEFHTSVPCSYCNLPQAKNELEGHMATCIKRPKKCLYCELELPFDKYTDHITVCGSRTTQCSKCKKYISKRNWEAHQRLPCEPVPPKETMENKFVGQEVIKNVRNWCELIETCGE